MKKLIYQVEGYTDVYISETKEVEHHLLLATVTIENPSDEDITRAKETAYNGEYTIVDDGQPEPAPVGDSVWDSLDSAYTTGYEEGYTEGVNSAYDQ